MKTTKKISSITLLCILSFFSTTYSVSAQKGAKKKEIKEKIEAQKTAFITQKLNLTSEEATVFWPVYNEYETKKENLSKEFRQINQPLRQKGIDEMTNTEAEAFVDNQLVHAQKMLDLKKEYLPKFKKVLPVKKVAGLQKAEREFQMTLLKKVRGKMNEKRMAEED